MPVTRQRLSRRLKRLRNPQKVPALAGKLNSDNTYTVKHETRKRFFYVRTYANQVTDKGRETIPALCTKYRIDANTPVIIEKNYDGDWEITDLRGTVAAELYQEAVVNYNMPDRVPTENNAEVVQGYQFQPFRARLTSFGSLYVYIEPGHYFYGTIHNLWGGGTLDLTAHVPTPGTAKLPVVITLDPVAGALTSSAGGTVTTTFPEFSRADYQDIAPAGSIPLWGITITGSQTTIDEFRFSQGGFLDMRPWLAMPGGLAYSTGTLSNPPTDAELDTIFGNPADIGNGFLGLVDVSGSATHFWMAATSGTNWIYFPGTMAS